MLLRRWHKLKQKPKSNRSSPVRFLNDGGSSLMEVRARLRYFKFSISCGKSGNLLSLMHWLRFKSLRDFIEMKLGRIRNSKQPPRSKPSSLARHPTDSWTLTNFWQWRRFNSFMFGAELNKFGNFLMYWQDLKFIYVKLLYCVLCREKNKSKFNFNKC